MTAAGPGNWAGGSCAARGSRHSVVIWSIGAAHGSSRDGAAEGAPEGAGAGGTLPLCRATDAAIEGPAAALTAAAAAVPGRVGTDMLRRISRRCCALVGAEQSGGTSVGSVAVGNVSGRSCACHEAAGCRDCGDDPVERIRVWSRIRVHKGLVVGTVSVSHYSKSWK